MPELFPVEVLHGLIELPEELQTIGSDTSFDDASVILLPLAGDPAVSFHAIEQAGHVGVPGNHVLGDAAAGEAFGFGATKDAEDVVLSGSQAGGLEDALGLLGKRIGQLEDTDEQLVLERDRDRALGHGSIIVVITTIVKREKPEKQENLNAKTYR
jgi:hypothetical protein